MNVWCIVSVIAVLQLSVVHRLQLLAEKEEHEQPHVIYDPIMSTILIASTSSLESTYLKHCNLIG